MELVPLHPKLVHLPIALAALMPLLAASLLSAWYTGFLPRRAWVIAVAVQTLLVGSGVAALRTGSAEEDRVERFVPEPHIEAHEEAAEMFVGGSVAVLLLAIGAAALRSGRAARATAIATAFGTLMVLFLGYRTGEAGGRLVYQHGAANAYLVRDAASNSRPAIAVAEVPRQAAADD